MVRDNVMEPILDLIKQVDHGQLTIDWNGREWVHLDANERNLEVDVAPLTGKLRALPGWLHESRISVWRNLGFPRHLAQLGWRVTFKAGNRPLVWLGRGASELMGHVHLEPAALTELARLL
jgi:hypothetical protein